MEGEVTILAILKVPDNQYCVKKTFHKRKKRYPLNLTQRILAYVNHRWY